MTLVDRIWISSRSKDAVHKATAGDNTLQLRRRLHIKVSFDLHYAEIYQSNGLRNGRLTNHCLVTVV